jgi:hypothetical protein
VMPGRFESRPSADVWVPLRPVFNPQNDGGPLFIVLGRLKPGATLKTAQSDMKRVGEQFALISQTLWEKMKASQ